MHQLVYLNQNIEFSYSGPSQKLSVKASNLVANSPRLVGGAVPWKSPLDNKLSKLLVIVKESSISQEKAAQMEKKAGNGKKVSPQFWF